MKKSHLGLRIIYLLVIAVFMTSLGNPIGALAESPSSFTATPLLPDSSLQIIKSGANEAGLVSVIVKLKGAALASYQGDIVGLPATSPEKNDANQLNLQSPASQAYLNYLDSLHKEFIAAQAQSVPQAKVTHDFTVVLNAISLILPADQISSLEGLPNVEAVYPDELLYPQTDNSPQFLGAPTIWTQLGGQESSGEGVIVGIIDTGIWPEHPSFSDPDPSGKPYASPAPTLSGNPRNCDFSGGSNPGPAFSCNNKLIGAYNEMTTYRALQPLLPSEYTSARDADGHGTHTSSTAAGDGSVAASIYGVSRGSVSGIAPRAQVIMYKVCGPAGCYSSDSAASVQQSILDGVNVINFSISGGSSPYSDSVEQAFLDAYSAGIFVAASAGNSGPSANTTDHRGPWVTTVAASTQNRAFIDTVTITADGGGNLVLTGASITAGIGPAPVYVPSGSTAAVQCDNPLTPGSVTGMVVICKRGNTGRAQKGYNVLQGGAVGMILYNQSTSVTDVETDNHYLPASHIQYTDGQQLLDFISSHNNVQATLTAGMKASSTGDIMASFSSRGGNGLTLGVSKPDITAPGVQILAGASPQHLTPADGGVALGPQGETFQAIAGTSMSSPHVAGSGALLKAEHPDWTPGQIKSALMTTAWTQVVKEDGVTPATPFDDGSGRVDLTKAGDPGLTFDVSPNDYIIHSADLWNVNYPSVYLPALAGMITLQRTAHNLLSTSSNWSLSVIGATDFTVSIPATMTVPANGNATFDITIDARDVPVGQVRSAMLYLTDEGSHTLHMPITLVRIQPIVTLDKTCTPSAIMLNEKTDCTVTFQNTALSPAYVSVTDHLPSQLKLVEGSVTGATVSASGDTLSWSGDLVAAQPPNITIGTGSTPAGGYLPLSAFGISPIAGIGDDTVSNFNVPSFIYAGETYSRLGVGSNGVVIIGGSTSSADTTPLNQSLPNPTAPNNVIAPFWTDLNPGAGGAVRIGTLTDGVSSWIVIDYAAVKEFSTTKTDTFEVWIGYTGAQDTSIAYGTVQGNGDLGLLTVGAENRFGNRGGNYYYNSTGTLPTNTTELVVTGTGAVASPPHIITFSATGYQFGKWINYVEMTSYQFQGTSIIGFPGEVLAVNTYLPIIRR